MQPNAFARTGVVTFCMAGAPSLVVKAEIETLCPDAIY
jgi:hypothetical protein